MLYAIKCKNCKIGFETKERRKVFCTKSCYEKFSQRNKPMRINKKIQSSIEWRYYWNLYHNGLVLIENMKSLMKDDYVTNYRPQIANSQKHG